MQNTKNSKGKDNTLLQDLGVNRQNISDEIFNNLKQAILSGKLPEGYVFPNELVLCKQLGVGRSTLREILSSLETLNFITRSKRGTYVNSSEEIRTALNFNTLAGITQISDVLDFRSLLETGSIRIAANKVLDSDIAALKDIIEQMKRNINDSKQLAEYDYKFHTYLVDITGNQLIVTAFNAVSEQYRNLVKKAFDSGITQDSINAHVAIIKALEKRDPVEATACMANHMKNIAEYLLR